MVSCNVKFCKFAFFGSSIMQNTLSQGTSLNFRADVHLWLLAPVDHASLSRLLAALGHTARRGRCSAVNGLRLVRLTKKLALGARFRVSEPKKVSHLAPEPPRVPVLRYILMVRRCVGIYVMSFLFLLAWVFGGKWPHFGVRRRSNTRRRA
jgi:hypothetical protein